MEERDELRAWIRKALDFTASLPAKTKRPPTKAAVKKPSATKVPLRKSAAKTAKRKPKS